MKWNDICANSLLPERARSEGARSTAAVGLAQGPFHERGERAGGGAV